ncbi:MAG TPA: phasin family protein [Burkholderiales bacterium]|nr:phasin family protein [Burkholderiales bacterium]
MAKKLKALADRAGERQLATTIRDSAQQIWLAGLGAFGKTQEEGAKVFEALVKEGKHLEARTRKLAESKVSEMTSQWSKKTGQATARATATWDKLEQVFEDRVARALSRLGVPTKRDIQALAKRVETLTASVQKLTGARKPRAAARKR